ncbi:hypothetical protein GCM10019817_11210 [Lactobacillus intestinalis]|uniref:Major facilitator superfamily (MFS) profile domain-containing protein n=1 Tax=Lactobacillus intestinalis DSM 6629 TaxID=1423761 RepID=A0ABR5PTL0_9LACO|nr:hypothetical protein FC44_GL000784 [Lactobacillus intestinalis DSM 6629]
MLVLFLIGVYMFWNLVVGAMGFFMPYVYETVGGLSNTQANILQGCFIGIYCFSRIFWFCSSWR